MPGYEITFTDGEVMTVAGADGYLQEGPLTTFYRSDGGRGVLDSWSVRLASLRTADVRVIRRAESMPADAPLALAG